MTKLIMKINIISRKNGVGLSQDIKIIEHYLNELGIHTTFHDFSEKIQFSPIKYDINVFLEIINIRWMTQAKENWIIPNQEWFEPHWKNALLRFNKILCKTHHAFNIFRTINKRSRYIGFTSEDKYDPNIDKDFNQFLHIAGKSGTKQTNLIWETWKNNPQLPQLTIVQDKNKFIQREKLSNLTYIYDRLEENELKEMQNKIGIHLCPSEAEGFGHYIMEALSCQSVVLTTNASPMTELVQKETGFYVDVVKQERMRLSLKNIISVETLEKAVININITEEQELVEMGKRGREFYLNNDKSFKIRFKQIIKDIIKG